MKIQSATYNENFARLDMTNGNGKIVAVLIVIDQDTIQNIKTKNPTSMEFVEGMNKG